MADNSKSSEIFRHHVAAQDKYTYFLLAAAGAAIALALQKTELLPLSWPVAICGVAVLLWGLSFYCGCRNLSWVKSCMHANSGLLQLQEGIHPEQPDHPQLVMAAISGVREALERSSNKAAFYYKWQFRLLLGGAIAYICWHIYRMALNG
jgi:hypothetical protein